MIDEADKDGDGEVNEAEFLRIMKKTNLYWYYAYQYSRKISLNKYMYKYHVLCIACVLECSAFCIYISGIWINYVNSTVITVVWVFSWINGAANSKGGITGRPDEEEYGGQKAR